MLLARGSKIPTGHSDCLRWFVCSFVYAFIRLFVRSFVRLFVCSFFRLFFRPFVRSFKPVFITFHKMLSKGSLDRVPNERKSSVDFKIGIYLDFCIYSSKL